MFLLLESQTAEFMEWGLPDDIVEYQATQLITGRQASMQAVGHSGRPVLYFKGHGKRETNKTTTT